MDTKSIKDLEILQEISKIDEIEIIGPVDHKKRGALVSFKVKGVEAALDVGRFLDEQISNYQIMVRSGAHCVHPFHYSLGISPKQGTSRASLYIYNSLEEIDIFIESLKRFIKIVT